jgi:copper(I)-binding protein
VNRSTSRSVLAGLVVAGGLALSACASGQIAQTAQMSPTVDGQMAQVGSLAIRNVALDYPAGGVYERGSDARLRMVVVNGGVAPDSLVSVSSPVATDVTISAGGSAEVTGSATPEPTGSASESASPTATPSDTASGTATPSASPGGSASPSPTASPTPSPTPENAQIQIPPNSYVSFREDGPRIMLTGLTRQLRPGQNLVVTLTFQRAGSVTMTIAVGTPEAQLPPAPTVSVEPGGESEG